MGTRICNIQYIDNILQYMQRYNILLPEANAATCMVRQRRTLQCIWRVALRGYNALQRCSIWLQYIATLLNMLSPCFDAYIYAAMRVAPDLKLSLSTTSRLQTHSHIHLPIYACSSAFYTHSTTFIVPRTPR